MKLFVTVRTADVNVLQKGKALPEGSVRDWKGQKYKKQNGKWVRVKRERSSSDQPRDGSGPHGRGAGPVRKKR